MTTSGSIKKVTGVYTNPRGHWVGDGFPVRSLFSYDGLGQQVSPFLLLDFAGPHHFAPASQRRGVGEHPHRGFETVTIVYDGEVEHRDSAGNGGIIGPGDVQWMTAAGGILHEEFHSAGFTKTGGPFRMIQLWVNLPAKDKMTPPRYQPLLNAEIPVVTLPDGAGKARIIAGRFGDQAGAAKTFTPINLWDLRLVRDADATFDLPDGHTSLLVVVSGRITVNGSQDAGEAEMVVLDRAGTRASVHGTSDATVLVLTGAPINEPIAGYGPFVMNTDAEIRTAIADLRAGRFGAIAAA